MRRLRYGVCSIVGQGVRLRSLRPKLFRCKRLQHVRDLPLAAAATRERTGTPGDGLGIKTLLEEQADLCTRCPATHANHLVLSIYINRCHAEKFYMESV